MGWCNVNTLDICRINSLTMTICVHKLMILYSKLIYGTLQKIRIFNNLFVIPRIYILNTDTIGVRINLNIIVVINKCKKSFTIFIECASHTDIFLTSIAIGHK